MNLDTVSKLLNIPKSTLRYWEQQGLIQAKRGENNYRYYDDRYVVDVSDILLLRKLNVPIHEINRVKMMCPAELEDFYENLSENIDAQIEFLHQTKKLTEKRRKLVYHIQKVRNNQYTTVNFTDLNIPDSIQRFDITQRDTIQNYLDRPFDSQYVLFWSPGSYSNYQEGWIRRKDDLLTDLLWTPGEKNKKHKYLRCLLEGDGIDNHTNNLQEHLQYMHKHNLTPGHVIATYLHEAYSREQQKILSYYDTYIEVLE